MPYVEVRGNSIRVKWWGGEYKLDDEGKPTKKKKYEQVSGPEPGIPFETEEEAYTYGLDREYEVRHGTHILLASAKTPMDKYCWIWFNAIHLRPNSRKTYKSMLKAVIEPDWKGRPVGAITPPEYDMWSQGLSARYSDNYARDLRSVFRMLMEDAVLKYRLRSDSPIIEQRRRGRYTKKQTRRKKRPLPIEVVHQLATNAYHVWGYTGWAYIWTIAFTAMRPPGELYGLQRGYASPNWPGSDPDEEQRQEALERYGSRLHALRVQYQMYYEDGAPALAGPKYESHRTLVIPPFLHEMHAILLASHDQPFVFLSKMGKPLLGTNFAADYWHPIRDGSKEWIPRNPAYVRFARPELPAVKEMAGQDIYRLRHWARSLLDEPGADVADVAKEARMGHELAGIQGVYSEVTLAMEKRIVDYLQQVWEKFLASGPWLPPFPIALPDDHQNGAPPQFSGYRVL